MVRKVIKLVGRGNYTFVPFPPGRKEINVENYYVSYNKLKSMVSWEPKTPFEEGLKATIEFYRTRLNKYI